MEHILRRIVLHVAYLADVVVGGRDAELRGGEHFGRFVQSPGEVVAIIVQREVGVLGCIESAAFAVAQPLVHPAHDVAGDAGKLRLAEGLVCVHVVLQQFAVVVRHLLEVGDDPVFVHGVTVKAAREMVVNAALRHLVEGLQHRFPGRVWNRHGSLRG